MMGISNKQVSLTHSRQRVFIGIPAEFHFLVAGIKAVPSCRTFCNKIFKNWSRMMQVGGISQHKSLDSNLARET